MSDASAEKPIKFIPNLAIKVKRSLAISYASYVGLMLLFAWNFITNDAAKLSHIIIQVVPLAIFIPGMITRYYRTYSWMCFVLLFYFTWAVPEAFSAQPTLLDMGVLIFSSILFVSAMMASRYLQYESVQVEPAPQQND